MNRDDRTPGKINAIGNEAGCEPARRGSGGSNSLKNRAPSSESCRANATVIRYLAPTRHDRTPGMKTGPIPRKVTDLIATMNATVKRPGHSDRTTRTSPGETSLDQNGPGKKILGSASFPMMLAKTVASPKTAEAIPVESRMRIDSRT